MKKYILIFLSISIFNIYNIKAQVNGAILQGTGVTASGQYSSAIGHTCKALGAMSFAGGWNAAAEGNVSFAFGDYSIAKLTNAIALGGNAQAYRPYTIAIGNNTVAGMSASPFSGTNAICIGNQSEAIADYSMAFGQYVKSSGNNSIAIGKGFSNTQFLVNNTANTIALGMGSTVPTMFITNSGGATATGNVGIGTTNIGSKLQVNGNAAIGYSSSTAAPANGLLINGNLGIGTTAAATTEKLTVNGKVKTNALVLPDGEINSFAALNLWSRNGNDIYRKNGKVGIGTTSPSSVLTLSGVSPDILLSNNTEVENESHDFRIISSNGAGRLVCSGDMAVFLDAQNTHDIESFQIFANCDFYGTPAQCPNIKQLFVVTNGGSSINTNLNINGNMMLYDDGRIWAKEIKVALNNPWADFVFDKNYKLRSLSEVEAFVNTHKHLPDVPSVAEVAKNGIDLAEMNKILLQKIEELTLYTIKLEKRINEIEKK